MIFFLSIKWSLNKTLLVSGVIGGVRVGLVCGAGWGGGIPDTQVPEAFLIHLDFLEKLNHYPHLQNKRKSFCGREKEDL